MNKIPRLEKLISLKPTGSTPVSDVQFREPASLAGSCSSEQRESMSKELELQVFREEESNIYTYYYFSEDEVSSSEEENPDPITTTKKKMRKLFKLKERAKAQLEEETIIRWK